MGRGHDSTELVEVRPRLQFSRANARIRWRTPAPTIGRSCQRTLANQKDRALPIAYLPRITDQ
jgi:hypothetical protein